MKKLLKTLGILCVCLLLAAAPAFASGFVPEPTIQPEPAIKPQHSAKISVTLRQTGTITSQTCRFVLAPAEGEEGNPLPDADENVTIEGGKAVLTITSDRGEVTYLLTINTYTRPGVYSYTLRQEAGTDYRTTYDSTEYNVFVYVTNAAEGGFDYTTAAYRKGNDEDKCDIVFVNYREPDPTATPSPTPTPEPTATPTPEPTATPTPEPTATPTVEPTATPTVEPTATPTVEPTATPEPTAEPTATPTVKPTAKPDDTPKTGVQDRWPAYLIGAAVVLALGACSFVLLRRKEDSANEKK